MAGYMTESLNCTQHQFFSFLRISAEELTKNRYQKSTRQFIDAPFLLGATRVEYFTLP